MEPFQSLFIHSTMTRLLRDIFSMCELRSVLCWLLVCLFILEGIIWCYAPASGVMSGHCEQDIYMNTPVAPSNVKIPLYVKR